ncbi:hypothetical protein GCM10022252_34670 [Streptosporangium oxazolinicum]|uniref:Uncharacterized protein n=1 Tax=Streptosporangium oxazolinicum TaxID=909287 RepID=A0ABP8AX86_9ACTN
MIILLPTMTTTRTVSFDLRVSYGQAYLVDDTDDNPGYATFTDDHPDHPVGIIRVEDGAALLLTGTHRHPRFFGNHGRPRPGSEHQTVFGSHCHFECRSGDLNRCRSK